MDRVGILPFSMKDEASSLLFVTSQTRRRWVLPKGRLKKGESHAAACRREAFEEAGILGVVLEDFPIAAVIGRQTSRGIEKIPVIYYPFLVTEQAGSWPEKKERKRHWMKLSEAMTIVHRDDFLALIRRFDDLRSEIIQTARTSVLSIPQEHSSERG